MKVLHVISGISRQGGGPSRSSQGLVAALNRAGCEAQLLALSGEKPWLPGVSAAPEDALTRLRDYDLVHLHGIWDPRLHQVAVACRRDGVPYVIAPRGMLEPWSLKAKWLKKRIARFLYQDKDLRCAAALHATAESEAEQFKKLGFANPVIISPNGVNLPEKPIIRTRLEKRRALYVSRCHPKKGILEFIEAWAQIRPMDWVCELVYTCNSDFERDYEAKIKARVNELGLVDAFVFTGALDDEKKWLAYGRANLFVLPTYSENFGIVIAEALYAGLPVVTTKGTPWQELETVRCGWWIETGVDPLVSALKDAFSRSAAELAEMGARGRQLVEDKYTWEAACKEMLNGYREVCHGYESLRNEMVRSDKRH